MRREPIRFDRRQLLAGAGAWALAPLLRALPALPRGGERSLILLWLDGGMSHLDTFDCKPEAPVDIRGDLGATKSALDGVLVSEHLPKVAAALKHCVVVRSLTSGEGNHDRASHFVLTGHRPSPVLAYPSLGSWLGHVRPTDGAIPDYVAIPTAPDYGKQGFLPATRLPFEVGGEPHQPAFRVPDLAAPEGRERALALLAEKDRLDGVPRSPGEAARDRFQVQARALAEDPEARTAFDLAQEPKPLRDRYGRHALGQSCLLARRLVARGARVVLVSDRGWDHHQNMRRALTYGFPPKLVALDDAFSALVEDLEASGLGERVVVALLSEFGRTPRLNPQGGRDHWPRASSVVLYGAGLPRGAVIGATDRRGEEPSERPVSPADLHATILKAMGVDWKTQLRTADGRPVPVVETGAEPVV
jgi:hypothetical protein